MIADLHQAQHENKTFANESSKYLLGKGDVNNIEDILCCKEVKKPLKDDGVFVKDVNASVAFWDSTV